MSSLNYIDLFAGAGGLSEGFYRAGYKPAAHVEMDAAACNTLRTRSAYYYIKEHGLDAKIYQDYIEGKTTTKDFYKSVPASTLESVIEAEVSDETIPHIFSKIDRLLGDKKVDVIIGGPPCQVYSLVGRSRIGKDNVSSDKRYNLYIQYAEFLKRYKPAFFVFENVQGLLSAEGGQLVKTIKQALEDCGYTIEYKLLNSSDFGVLQDRKRVILIGRRGKSAFKYPDFKKWEGEKWSSSDALFADLPFLKPGDAPVTSQYTKPTNTYLETSNLRNGVTSVSQHISRPHNERDLEIYRIAIEKWLTKKERLKYSDLPQHLKTHKNEKDFQDRFKVVDPDGNSHTVVAHIAKDGHYFIYPDLENPRSISVREAARIQSFPDDFFFEGGRTNAFKQIGNAVPPMLGEVIAGATKHFILNDDPR